jgi:hypothetical protein
MTPDNDDNGADSVLRRIPSSSASTRCSEHGGARNTRTTRSSGQAYR